MHVREHLRTVGRHRRLVRHYCLRLGLVWQGLTHDLSKYSPTEFWRSAKYYQGYRSPNDQERKENGVSLSWLHHKGRNRHHFEYWIDYCLRPDGSVYMGGCKMPKRYVAEMFCDRIAACRVYQGEKYTDASPYDYYQKSKDHILINQETSDLLDRWLLLLKEHGEEAALPHRQVPRPFFAGVPDLALPMGELSPKVTERACRSVGPPIWRFLCGRAHGPCPTGVLSINVP